MTCIGAGVCKYMSSRHFFFTRKGLDVSGQDLAIYRVPARHISCTAYSAPPLIGQYQINPPSALFLQGVLRRGGVLEWKMLQPCRANIDTEQGASQLLARALALVIVGRGDEKLGADKLDTSDVLGR